MVCPVCGKETEGTWYCSEECQKQAEKLIRMVIK